MVYKDPFKCSFVNFMCLLANETAIETGSWVWDTPGHVLFVLPSQYPVVTVT